jgi:transposase InsO family protein
MALSSAREFENYYLDAGIIRHHTTVGTLQQNGVAERMNRTLLERTLCMLSHVGLPQSLWVETVTTTCYLVNRSPSIAIDCKIPEEVWSGKPPHYDHLRVFGCPSYAHIRQNKLETRALECLPWLW